MQKKIRFLLVILCIVATLSGCAQNAEREAEGSDAAVALTHVRQLVAADNKTARTIMWEARVKQPYTLEYRKQGSKDIQAVQATDSSFTDKDSVISILPASKALQREARMSTALKAQKIRANGTGCIRKLALASPP